MTLFREEQRICAVCGQANMQTVLRSTTALGSPDLDTRPPPLARMTLPLYIQCCPACGYCARDVSEALPAVQNIVTQPEYQAQLHSEQFPYLANLFLCYHIIQQALDNYAEAGWAVVFAAWACDDAGPAFMTTAARLREKAVAFFTEARERSQAFAPSRAEEDALLADLLRRSGHFTAAQKAVEQGLAHSPDHTVQSILRFQHHLCRQHNPNVYTVQDALAWAERTNRPMKRKG